jgi:hypothetical protein
MVHQYDLDTPKTSLENAYEEFKANVNDAVSKSDIINKALDRQQVKTKTTKEDLISLFNPNRDFIESYNKRTLKEQEKQAKEEKAKLVDENGQPYEQLWKHEGFRQIHDPLSTFYNLRHLGKESQL